MEINLHSSFYYYYYYFCVLQVFHLAQLDILDTTLSTAYTAIDHSTETSSQDFYTLVNTTNITFGALSSEESSSDALPAASAARVYVPVTQTTRQAAKTQRKRGSSVVGTETKVKVIKLIYHEKYSKIILKKF